MFTTNTDKNQKPFQYMVAHKGEVTPDNSWYCNQKTVITSSESTSKYQQTQNTMEMFNPSWDTTRKNLECNDFSAADDKYNSNYSPLWSVKDSNSGKQQTLYAEGGYPGNTAGS